MSITQNDKLFIQSVWNTSLLWAGSSSTQDVLNHWQTLMHYVAKELGKEFTLILKKNIFTFL